MTTYDHTGEFVPIDAETLFGQLEYNTGEFPEAIVLAAVERRASFTPMLLEELLRAAADPVALRDKGESYIRHIYAMYLLAQFREQSAYPLLVDFVASPGEIVMDIIGDVVTEDLSRMLASLCHGDLEPIKRLIEDPEVNEWVRSAALDALIDLYAEGLLERESIIEYLAELFSFRIERKPSFVWSAMVNAACDLYPEKLMDEIRKAYDENLVDLYDVGFQDVEISLERGMENLLEYTRRFRRGLIGNVADEIAWWACFREGEDDEYPAGMLEDDIFVPPSMQEPVVRAGPRIGRNDPCPCGSGRKYKKCCLGKDDLLQ